MYMINTIPYGKCFVRYLHTRFCIRNLTYNGSMYVSLHGHFRLTCEQANLKEIIGERKWARRYFFADTHRSLVIYHVLWLLLSHGWAQEPLRLLIGSIKTGDVYHLHGRANLSVHGAWANGKQKFRRLYYFHNAAWRRNQNRLKKIFIGRGACMGDSLSYLIVSWLTSRQTCNPSGDINIAKSRIN